jgi:hypothetical protein
MKHDNNDSDTLRHKERVAKAALIASVHQAGEENHQLTEAFKPNAAITALFRLACGGSRAEACREANIDDRTLNKLIERHSDSLKMIRESSALKAAAVGEKGLELLGKKFQQLDDDPDALAKIDPAKIAVATGTVAVFQRKNRTREDRPGLRISCHDTAAAYTTGCGPDSITSALCVSR